jgi:hypothetical protein
MIKRLLLGLLAAGAGCWPAVLVANTLRQGSRQLEVPPLAPLAVDEAGVAAVAWPRRCALRTVSGLLDPAGTAPSSTSCTRC